MENTTTRVKTIRNSILNDHIKPIVMQRRNHLSGTKKSTLSTLPPIIENQVIVVVVVVVLVVVVVVVVVKIIIIKKGSRQVVRV